MLFTTKLYLKKTFGQDQLHRASLKVYRGDKLFDGRDKVGFAANFNLKEWIELVIVIVGDCALAAGDFDGKTDQIIKCKLVVVTLGLLDKYLITHNQLGALCGVYIGKASQIEIESENPLPVHTDGEPIFLQHDITAGCLPKKIRVITK